MNKLYPSLISDIRDGKLDADLTDIADMIRCRREDIKDTEARQLRGKLKVGDTVYFVSTIKPTYLAGVKATVTKFNPKKIVVSLSERHGRFHRGVICPPTLLTTLAP